MHPVAATLPNEARCLELRSAQVERLEVVETGRRLRRSEDERLKIVLESFQAPHQVAATARRYRVSTSLLLRWRRLFRPEPKDAAAQQIDFVPAKAVPNLRATPWPAGPVSSRGIEIEFTAGARMRITGPVDAALQGRGRGAGRWTAVMTPFPSGVRVWIATGYPDMRRGMNSLALLAQEALKRDLHGGDLY